MTRTPGRLLATLAAIVLAAGVGMAQQKPEEKARKLDRQQQQDVNALLKLVDAQMSATPPASELKLSMQPDFLKALEGRTYVPFIMTVDPALAGQQVALYVRVVDKNAPPPKPAGAPKPPSTSGELMYGGDQDKKQEEAASAPKFAFEDAHFFQVPKPEGSGPVRVARAFAVPAGEYDLYLAMKPRGNDKANANKTAVTKQSISVPDFWTNQLATSSVIVADRIDPVKETLSPERLAERPYLMGNTEITPALDTTFTKKDELSVIFLIYNPGVDDSKRPNVAVEYSFHQKLGEAEKYFNKTSPQKFDPTTLPQGFDMAAGHQLVAGQSVPLASFPEGDYRMEIKIVDNITKQSLTKNVTFTVQGS
jgi:hypothetical protein